MTSLIVDEYVRSIHLGWNSITKNRQVGRIVAEPSNVGSAAAIRENDGTPSAAF